MEGDIRIIRAEFYSIANDVFQTTYRSFRKDVSSMDRNANENVHQMIRSKYCNLLRHTLEYEANALIARCQGLGVRHELSTALTETIRFFHDEFLRKADEI